MAHEKYHKAALPTRIGQTIHINRAKHGLPVTKHKSKTMQTSGTVLASIYGITDIYAGLRCEPQQDENES
jgi:hypothetical protein